MEKQKMYCLILQPRDCPHQFRGLFSSLEEAYSRYEEIMNYQCERYKNYRPELLKSKIADVMHFNDCYIYECCLDGPVELLEDDYEYKQKVKHQIIDRLLKEIGINKDEQTK